MNTKQNGFTLIELMIVIAIVAIISSVAYGSYQKSVTRSKRTDAKTTLATLASEFERCFTMNGQYTATSSPAKTCSVSTTDANTLATGYTASGKGYYTMSGAISATAFTLTATPNGWTDSDCNVFTLTNTGQQNASGTWGTSRCWND